MKLTQNQEELLLVSQGFWSEIFFILTNQIYGKNAGYLFYKSIFELNYFSFVFLEYIEKNMEEDDFLEWEAHVHLLSDFETETEKLSSLCSDLEAEQVEMLAFEMLNTFLFLPRIIAKGSLFPTLPKIFHRIEGIAAAELDGTGRLRIIAKGSLFLTPTLDLIKVFFSEQKNRRAWNRETEKCLLSQKTILGYQRILQGFGIISQVEIQRIGEIKKILEEEILPIFYLKGD